MRLKFTCRKIKEQPLIWILLFFCLYTFVAYHIDTIKIPSNLSIEKAQQVNTSLYTLAISYISGMIIYILTVYIPYTQKSQVILINTSEDLRYLKDEMHNFLQIISDSDLSGLDKLNEQELLNFIKPTEKKNSLFEISIDNTNYFKGRFDIIDSYIKTIESYWNYLSTKQIKNLSEIRNSYSFNRIRHGFISGNSTYFNESSLIKFTNDLIETNKKIIKLYNNVKL